MKKRLVAWTGSLADITIGETYNIVDGDFRDNVGDIRSASYGDWENVQQGGDSVIKPGTIVDLTAVRDQSEYEEVCKAFMKAGADGHDGGEWMNGNYPWQEWNYVGWDMDTGNLIHYDSPESFSEDGDSSDVREIAVTEVLQSLGNQEPQGSGTVRGKLESGYIVDFEGGGSAMFVPKAFNGQDAFIGANGNCHDVNIEFDEDLRHPRSALNVVRIYDNMGGLGLGFQDNVASEGHHGRGVVWTRPKKEFTIVDGVKVDKAKLEEFLKENQEV